jgi:hypothetical protein
MSRQEARYREYQLASTSIIGHSPAGAELWRRPCTGTWPDRESRSPATAPLYRRRTPVCLVLVEVIAARFRWVGARRPASAGALSAGGISKVRPPSAAAREKHRDVILVLPRIRPLVRTLTYRTAAITAAHHQESFGEKPGVGQDMIAVRDVVVCPVHFRIHAALFTRAARCNS